MAAVARRRDLSQALLGRWVTFLAGTRTGTHGVFAPWHALAAVPDAEFVAKAPATLVAFAPTTDAGKLVNPKVWQTLSAMPLASLEDAAKRYQQLLLNPPPGDQQLLHALDSIGGPLNIAVDQTPQFLDRAARNQYQELRRKADAFKATSPAAPARAMSLEDLPNPVNPRVFLRGNPNNPGPEVPRQFVAIVAGASRKPFAKGSGRLELAQAIASKENPLTARVMVNRVWGWHFGQGLVRTYSDFGVRSEPPSHPELLDYLSSYLMENNWSLKKLHRLIMLSSVYQQSSDTETPNSKLQTPNSKIGGHNPQSAIRNPQLADPENNLLWHFNRQRLDLEGMRDSLLFVSGALDLTLGGPSVEITTFPSPPRRTVYGFIDRQNLPGLFRTFDFASPDSHSPQRYSTTVPQQALFLMNSPFVVDLTRKLMARPEMVEAKTPEARIQQLYRLAYARAATPEEVTLGLEFVKSLEGNAQTAGGSIWQYGYGEFDAAAKRVKNFTPLPHFTGQAWQGGPALPDPKLGFAILNSEGGHPGNDLQHAVVRRWTAPGDGSVSIAGVLRHESDKGDGVRAQIVSSRTGFIGGWTAQRGVGDTNVPRIDVKKGDTLDFIVDCRTTPDFDAFSWAPTITTVQGLAGSPKDWSAVSGFSGPAGPGTGLTPWEKYAQVLLLSNEFAFVD